MGRTTAIIFVLGVAGLSPSSGCGSEAGGNGGESGGKRGGKSMSMEEYGTDR